ncbi:putative clathrin assembly protein At4g40080 [Macadamia integrifolia]|uniref:putative clathrin assembly protein At4g40080 n=1 Tax=Macadamia integrifolia TaxID=60698 RepID=UPI001C4FB05A|nr:putative clathrin assembly protein At4g40080 [Macadamia integrifolia]
MVYGVCVVMGGLTKGSFRDLMGVLKDKASLSKAALLCKPSTVALQVAVLRATTHEPSNPPNEKQLAALLSFGHSSRLTASACIDALMGRLHQTRNSAVALKCLIIIHHIIRRGSFILLDQLTIYPSTGGRNYLNLSNFRDNASPESWELSSWVRWYATFLEHLLLASRVLGFLFSSNSDKGQDRDKVSALLNYDLLKEVDALVGVIEEIYRAPESLFAQGNRLVNEVKSLVKEDYWSAQKEISFQIDELRQRVNSLRFEEAVDLVRLLKRLENCREKVLGWLFMNKQNTMVDLFWDSIGDVRTKIGTVKDYGEGKKLLLGGGGKVEKASESARFGDRVLRLGDPVQFSSGRFALDLALAPSFQF